MKKKAQVVLNSSDLGFIRDLIDRLNSKISSLASTGAISPELMAAAITLKSLWESHSSNIGTQERKTPSDLYSEPWNPSVVGNYYNRPGYGVWGKRRKEGRNRNSYIFKG